MIPIFRILGLSCAALLALLAPACAQGTFPGLAAPNQVIAGPISGGVPALPSPRPLVAADINGLSPALTGAQIISTDAPINVTGTSNPFYVAATFTGTVFPASSEYAAGWINIETQNGYSNCCNFQDLKSTPVALQVNADYNGAGQKFGINYGVNCWGIGDCFGQSYSVVQAGADVSGDEGTGFTSTGTFVGQSTGPAFATVATVTRSACNTTTTAPITGNPNTSQIVPVVSTTGCNINDWVVFNQQNYTANNYNTFPMKITAVNPGVSISGVIAGQYSGDVTVTPALVLGVTGSIDTIGQLRFAFNFDAGYNTGTAEANSNSNHITGIGTSWTTTMVGGNASNIGCIRLGSDDLTAGPGSIGTPYQTWYQIIAVNSGTDLQIASFAVDGNTNYRGFGIANPSTYQIRPCATILYRDEANKLLIMDTTPSTWNVSDGIVIPTPAYPDFHGLSLSTQTYSPGGTYRQLLNLSNIGARTWQQGISITGNMVSGGNADTEAFLTAINIGNPGKFNIGISLTGAQGIGINLLDYGIAGGIEFNSFGNIQQVYNGSNQGIQIADGAGIILIGDNYGAPAILNFLGSSSDMAVFQIYNSNKDKTGFVTGHLPTCNSNTIGSISWVSDSNTNTWGATIATGGSDVVLGFCDGSNWTVAAK